jgi:hypothetical protein
MAPANVLPFQGGQQHTASLAGHHRRSTDHGSDGMDLLAGLEGMGDIGNSALPIAETLVALQHANASATATDQQEQQGHRESVEDVVMEAAGGSCDSISAVLRRVPGIRAPLSRTVSELPAVRPQHEAQQQVQRLSSSTLLGGAAVPRATSTVSMPSLLHESAAPIVPGGEEGQQQRDGVRLPQLERTRSLLEAAGSQRVGAMPAVAFWDGGAGRAGMQAESKDAALGGEREPESPRCR